MSRFYHTGQHNNHQGVNSIIHHSKMIMQPIYCTFCWWTTYTILSQLLWWGKSNTSATPIVLKTNTRSGLQMLLFDLPFVILRTDGHSMEILRLRSLSWDFSFNFSKRCWRVTQKNKWPANKISENKKETELIEDQSFRWFLFSKIL